MFRAPRSPLVGHQRTSEVEYLPFPNEHGRNSRQESLEVPWMIRLLRLTPGTRVLEIGCGRGVALPGLAKLLQPSRLVGVDQDRTLLSHARDNLELHACRAELVVGDVRQLPLGNASFDLVIDFGTCYHIARPATALAEVARVLAPAGLFVHETPISQLLSHPVRSLGRRIPWGGEPRFRRCRTALLWSSRRRLPDELAVQAL